MSSLGKNGIVITFLAINALIIFFALNPWLSNWRAKSLVVLIFEVVFLLVIGIPILLYQMIWRKKTFTQSLSDSLNAVLDFLSNFG